MATRKLVKLGKSSVVVSLPKDWLKELDLEPGDEVLLKKEFDGSLKIIPIKDSNKRVIPEIEINIDQCGMPGLLERVLKGSYITGRERIIIKTSSSFKGEQFKVIRQLIEKIRGVEILEQSINKIELKAFLDPTKFKLSLLLKRSVSLLVSMLEYYMKGVLDGERDLINETIYMYDEVYRIYLTMVRQLVLCQIQRDLLEMVELENPLQILESRVIINNLNTIGFELNSLANYTLKGIDKIRLEDEKLRNTISAFIKEIIKEIHTWFESYVRRDIFTLNELENKILNKREKYEEEIDKLCVGDIDVETRKFIKRVFSTLLFVKYLIKDIVEATINMLIIKPPMHCAVLRSRTEEANKIEEQQNNDSI